MATRRTLDLLPEIFRTDTNRKFLAATLDQLTQEPSVKRTQGFVGRRVGPGVNPADYYVTEQTATRADYQLEPGIVFQKPDSDKSYDAITYPGIIDALNVHGSETVKQDRLFESQYYTWDPFCDFDKFSNYSQYYWLPGGPEPVNVATVDIPTTNDFTVTRSITGYTLSGNAGTNPIITLVRGGNYTFTLDQPGHKFWIQAAPGVEGRMPASPNISSRDVLGAINNGQETGQVELYVPLKTAQNFYYSMPDLQPVDLLTYLQFNQINNVYVDSFLTEYPNGIDGLTALNGRTIVFANTVQDSEQGGWQVTTPFDPLKDLSENTGLNGSFDTLLFDQTTNISTAGQRYSIWQIRYVYDYDNRPYMVLNNIAEIPSLNKFRISYGATYSNTLWYKNASGFLEQAPLLTAVQDVLYYQDSTNPELFGVIKLIDSEIAEPVDINDIIGAKTYTSPNGVEFTNGLKVVFRGTTEPSTYQNLTFYVEGVGTGLGINKRVGFIDGRAYFGPFHIMNGRKITGATATGYFQQYIYETVEESLEFYGFGTPLGAPLSTEPTVNTSIGNGIVLIPTQSLVTPETYTKNLTLPYDSTGFDDGAYDTALDAPLVPDYITINRSAQDRNAWSRSNRWFHIDVIRAAATYNNQTPLLNNEFRAKRPIVEFRANVKLFNYGTQGISPVDIIDYTTTDALSNINGQLGFSTDGYNFIDGSRVIFASDKDPQVRNRVYEVRFIDPTLSGTEIIDLIPDSAGEIQINQAVVALSGVKQQGKSFWFDGVDWLEAQAKIDVNQPPLFEIYDNNGVSFSNRAVYPSSTFTGSKLFGYAFGGTQTVDEILGFALKYANLNNVGDIVFENYLYTDKFIFVRDNVSTEQYVSTGFARQYENRIEFSDLIGWQTAAAPNQSRQIFRFTYNGEPLVLDVPVNTNTVYPSLQIFVESVFIDPKNYTTEISNTGTKITFTSTVPVGTVVEVQALSAVASNIGYYQVPLNLENNPLNENSSNYTLGTIRTHYESMVQNLKSIVGPINGANNTRDLGNIIPYGDNIVQHSAPLALTGTFLRRQQYELFNSIQFNSQEYTKFKNRLLNLASKGDFINFTATQILDSVLQELSLGRSAISPFYWSDMIPSGETYTEISYTYTTISTAVFDTTQVYNFTSSNFQGLLVFLNGTLLVKDYDYIVSTDSATIAVTATLAIGDQIVIREYPTTYGSYVPNTPSKMGLYPSFKPEIYIDTTYVNPTEVISGHDGSITVAFGDIRDQVLLEFEKRIFNNLKIDTPVPIVVEDVVPGQFRKTEYSLSEINGILSPDFLSWVSWNNLDYTTQTYLANDPFTYNYSQSSDRLTGKPLLGAWRGIYNYFYDTINPNSQPWEMLGFSKEPTWWQTVYGPAPYTSGNMVLWNDLEKGFIADPLNPRIDPRYVRPGLTRVIPSDDAGQLQNPLKATVGNYDATSFSRSWVFGDDGPVENAWRTSSAYPFAVMRLLALTKPAKFFSLFADRDRYVYNDILNQYLWDERYRLNANQLTPLYGDGTSKASYLNWIIDYNRQLGINSTQGLTEVLGNIDVRLCWRMGAFSDKKYLKIFAERSTPNGLNTSLLLPDESYQLLLYKNQPFAETTYSSVIIQNTDDGWAVYGYSALQPYFEILASRPGGITETINTGGVTARVPVEYSNNIVKVPYGFVFTNRNAVCDFVYSYGKLLEQRGFVFDLQENGYIVNWRQMAQEFLYWSNQGWGPGSVVNLNPGANRISVTQPGSIVDSLVPTRPENIILNQNKQPLPARDMVIDRFGNTFRVTTLGESTINYLNLQFTSYEHLVVIDNVSIFSDLIYQPVTGARQSRVRVAGTLSADWDGTVNAPGFVLNQDNIVNWVPNQKYAKGEIVLFKDQYYSASTIIQPGQDFNYNLWIKSDYAQVQKGLLPNAANDSDQLAQAYSIYDANLEQETDLFSYGLIGFRPRQYMQALNLDDISQVNLYQEFLGIKGTIQSAELFSLADLGKETAEYNIYEYWAMLRGTYGANANRSYFELLMNEALLQSDPALIQVIQPGEESRADQTVLLDNVWKSSYKLTSPKILPTTLESFTDVALPTAGYVNLNDVDITAFSLDDTASLSANLNIIGEGTTVWIAKTNEYNWDVYRCERVPGNVIEVTDNLDGLSLVSFTTDHGLAVGEFLIIKYFDTAINGVYKVINVPNPTQVLINYSFTGFQTTATGSGIGFTLHTARVAQAADVNSLPYADLLTPGARAWVDNNSLGRWEVLEKTSPFVADSALTPRFNLENSKFGSSISQGLSNLSALIGAPGYNPDNVTPVPGAFYSYVKSDFNVYEQNTILTLGAANTEGYGNAVDIGNKSWAVAGASKSNSNQGYACAIYVRPGSNFFDQRQLLIPDQVPNQDEFGYAVTMSMDERWMYIGSPGLNKVYAYSRVDVQQQEIEYITTGTFSYNWSDHLKLTNYPEQMNVVLDNVLLTYGVDYTVNSTDVLIAPSPEAGKSLIISRRQGLQLDQQTYNNVTQDSATGSGTGATFTINRVRGVYFVTLISPGLGYAPGNVLTINAATIGGGTSPGNDLTITVTTTSGLGGITAFTQSGYGVSNTSIFPLDPYLATAVDIFSFSVTVNDKLYRPFIDYEFNSDSALLALDLVFNTVPPIGATILVDSQSHWEYVTVLTVDGIESNARFGHSISTTTDGRTLLVGTPRTNGSQGKVYVFDRSIQSLTVTDATQTAYTTVQPMVAPTWISLNGEYLLNTELNNGGTFTIDNSNQFTLNTTLAYGDNIRVGTNQFDLIQVIESADAGAGYQFGYAIDQCVNNCSLFVGAPYTNSTRVEAGMVEYYRNQARTYGKIESNIANPVLTAGNYIRINDVFVECTGTKIEDLYADIVAAKLPNVTVRLSPDVVFVSDGATTVYNIGSIYSGAESYTTKVYVDDVLQTEGVNYTYDNTTQEITFKSAPTEPSRIVVVSGRIIFTVTNAKSVLSTDKIQVLPGTGTLFNDLSLTVYVMQQTIVSPVPQDYAHFGERLFISDNTATLIVSAPNGTTIAPTTFDNGTTLFDDRSTNFADPLTQSGSVYTYDFLPATNASVTNPGQFVFGQQVIYPGLQALDQYGAAIDYTTGTLLIGIPGSDLEDSQLNYGQVAQQINLSLLPAWLPTRVQVPAVNTELMNTIYMYDRVTNKNKNYFDFFDPTQGRLLGPVRQNLDYIGAVDPAAYNYGPVNNYGNSWGATKVGNIWWNTSRARFIDPKQDDIVYASRRWGQLFPGSTVDIYQWISSSVPPMNYAGPGTPYNTESYVATPYINEQGIFGVNYFFWVGGIRNVDRDAGKTLSITALTQYIENPRSSGIPYVAPINSSTLAIYNGLEYISAQDTVIHVEFDQQLNEDAVHVEYQLIPQNRADGFLNDTLYRKFLDSLTGSDTAGNPVPDPFLSPSEKYGVQFRPRQSMVINRFLALENYLQSANTVMAQLPISETKKFSLLNSEEPRPTAGSGQWNYEVANYEELTFQDLEEVPAGYLYLVNSDSTNGGLWAIYEVLLDPLSISKYLSLVRVQNYDTKKYWNYINWFAPGYNPLTRVLVEVPTYSALTTLTVPNGSSVKVASNAQGKYEIYLLETGTWRRVGLEDGTVEISAAIWDYNIGRFGFDIEVFDAQYYDQAPIIETRQILKALNQEILIDDLAIERNKLLILVFNYIMSEEEAPDWLTKTSLIDVEHTIRELLPFQIYRKDNQDFVLDYINEVKPYHVQIREFNLKYQGYDQYNGSATDFDLPAYWDPAQDLFISPVLDNTGRLSTTSSVPSTNGIWQTFPYDQWYQNYLLNIESVTIVAGGANYIAPPEVVVTGDCITPAEMVARINSAGAVIAVDVVNPGVGYSTTAIINLVSGQGGGAQAVAVMGNSLVRDINTTIKYDRYQYQTDILTWEPNVTYNYGDLVRYDDRVWQADSEVVGESFDPSQWTLIPAGDLSGVDRTMGYYQPRVNEPGLDLALLISGIAYPGVQVDAPDFDEDTGFDVGNFDNTPYDNINYGPDGLPSYDPAILDAIYSSEFTDPYLGVLPAPAYDGAPPTTGPNPIIVDGAEFIDTYSSHAPEELVPGAIFDTLDMRVFTTPGADWDRNGHGFPSDEVNFAWSEAMPTVSYASAEPYPVNIIVFNQTQGIELHLGMDYTVDWVNKTVTVIAQALDGDLVNVNVYSIGGGNKLYTDTIVGSDIIGQSVIIPMNYSLIDSFVIFVNGEVTTNYTFGEFGIGYTLLGFGITYGQTDRITYTALGTDTVNPSYSWSVPLIQSVTSDGSQSIILTNSLQGTNPANLIVTKNGIRARPAEAVEYIDDGSSLSYYLPDKGAFSQGLIADNDVSVYVNGQPLTLGVGFMLDPWDGVNTRTITMAYYPPVGAAILISVRTASPYYVSGDTLIFKPTGGVTPVVGDVIGITTFNDTSQQDILTEVFVGPTSSGIQITEAYDDTLYDVGTINDDPGSFDYSEGLLIQTNRFDTGRIILDPTRVIVTRNGAFLFSGLDYSIDGSIVDITGPTVGAADVIAITLFTQSVAPGAIAFRIFQDMRGLQTSYRINAQTTTVLTQPLTEYDNIIYVDDVTHLDEPDLEYGLFGLITINGERITYRNRDTITNTVSGLRRGTAGTGVASHHVGSYVYNIGPGNILPVQYQNYIVSNTFMGDGSTTTFVADNISIADVGSTEINASAIGVFVGGIKLTAYNEYIITDGEPVTIEFGIAPPAGYEIVIEVERGRSWYSPGSGVALQVTETEAARFIRSNS